MVEAVSQVEVAWQDELWIGRTVGEVTTWTQILGIEELSAPEQVPDDMDVTHMQSPGRTRETKPGLFAVLDWSQDLQLWPGSAHDTLLEALYALTVAGTPETVQVEFLFETGDSAKRRTYEGYVNLYTPKGAVGDKRMAGLQLKIRNLVTSNPRVIA